MALLKVENMYTPYLQLPTILERLFFSGTSYRLCKRRNMLQRDTNK